MAEPVTNVGWAFELLHPNGTREPVYPAVGGQMSFDLNRDIPKAMTNLVWVPQERVKADFAVDEIEIFLVRNRVRESFGVFCFNEAPEQVGVVKDENGQAAPLITCSVGDRMFKLIRNTGNAESLIGGFDPSQEMQRILNASGLEFSVHGAVDPSGRSITWDGSTKDLAKVQELAELSGHRRPWMDNQGLIRSILPDSDPGDAIPLSSLHPVAGSTLVTPTYFSAPNRVIVSDNSFPEYPVVGTWEAPSASPHSFAQRGYYNTEVVELQGLKSNAHAEKVARTIGERATARTLNVQILPTTVLDGPVVLSYDGSLWLVQSWSLGTEAGSFMSVTAQELP